MLLRRVAFATTAAVLILAAPAAASTAAAGPSPTPLILELILAAVPRNPQLDVGFTGRGAHRGEV